ncbi:MAG: cytidylate kinase [Candidatus Saccharimonadales bacterium]|jgi:cytidylate kinase
MSKGHVIGLGAMPGAGKDQLVASLEILGVQELHVGTLVRATAREQGFTPAENTREAFIPFWIDYCATNGPETLARVALEAAEKSGSNFVLNGVRTMPDAAHLAGSTNSTMVWLSSDIRIAAARVMRRDRIEDRRFKTIDECIADMERDLANEGNFPMGHIMDTSAFSITPVPNMEDEGLRTKRYDEVACYVMAKIGLKRS